MWRVWNRLGAPVPGQVLSVAFTVFSFGVSWHHSCWRWPRIFVLAASRMLQWCTHAFTYNILLLSNIVWSYLNEVHRLCDGIISSPLLCALLAVVVTSDEVLRDVFDGFRCVLVWCVTIPTPPVLGSFVLLTVVD